MTTQFADMAFFLTLPCFFYQVQLLVQVSCQYHHWFWSFFYNFLLQGTIFFYNFLLLYVLTKVCINSNYSLNGVFRKSEIPSSEFCSISGHWGELRENQQGAGWGREVKSAPPRLLLVPEIQRKPVNSDKLILQIYRANNLHK